MFPRYGWFLPECLPVVPEDLQFSILKTYMLNVCAKMDLNNVDWCENTHNSLICISLQPPNSSIVFVDSLPLRHGVLATQSVPVFRWLLC